MIKVTKDRIKAFGKYYSVNETISGLSADEEARLISLGVAEDCETKAEKPQSSPNTDESVKSEETQPQEYQPDSGKEVAANIQFNPDDCIVGLNPTKKGKSGK